MQLPNIKKRIPWNKGIKTGPNPEHSRKMKGKIPWNKGLKGWTNNGGFKKGHKGFNTIEGNKKISDAMKGRDVWWLKGKKLSKEHREKMRLSHLGAKNHFYGKKHKQESKTQMGITRKGKYIGEKVWNWKGGITPINIKIRNSPEGIFWRKSVFHRDKYTCVHCGDSRGGNLEADHIKPFAYYPELRFDINNGRTLCKSCHKKTDTYGTKNNK